MSCALVSLFDWFMNTTTAGLSASVLTALNKVSLHAPVSRLGLSNLAHVGPLGLLDLLLVVLLPLALTDVLCPLQVVACRPARAPMPMEFLGITTVKTAADRRLPLVIAHIPPILTAGRRLLAGVIAHIPHQMECSHLGSLKSHGHSPRALATVSLNRGP